MLRDVMSENSSISGIYESMRSQISKIYCMIKRSVNPSKILWYWFSSTASPVPLSGDATNEHRPGANEAVGWGCTACTAGKQKKEPLAASDSNISRGVCYNDSWSSSNHIVFAWKQETISLEWWGRRGKAEMIVLKLLETCYFNSACNRLKHMSQNNWTIVQTEFTVFEAVFSSFEGSFERKGKHWCGKVVSLAFRDQRNPFQGQAKPEDSAVFISTNYRNF